jgi:hypothetical protein
VLVLLSVGIVAATFSLAASYVIWRARGRSALSNMLAAAVAVAAAALIAALMIAWLMRIAFQGM